MPYFYHESIMYCRRYRTNNTQTSDSSTEKTQRKTALHIEYIAPMCGMELYNSVNVQLFQTLRTFTQINVTFLLNAEGNKNKE